MKSATGGQRESGKVKTNMEEGRDVTRGRSEAMEISKLSMERKGEGEGDWEGDGR